MANARSSSSPTEPRPLFALIFLLAIATASSLQDAGAPAEAPPPESPSSEDGTLSLLEALPYATWGETDDPTKRGVELWDPERAWEGVNLYTNDSDEAYLMDMSGRRLHTWYMPDGSRHCEHFELVRRGEIVAECQGQWLVRLDAESHIVWQRQLPIHHDFYVDADESLIVLEVSHASYRGRRVNFGAITFLDADGDSLRTWDLYEHLAELREFHPPSPLDDPELAIDSKRYEYYHVNAIERLPDTPLGRQDRRFRAGNLLVSLRNVNTVLVLDQDSMHPTWSWGPRKIQHQHTPTMLSSGNLLIFDNGPRRGYSRVIEVDPASGEIVWSYDPRDPEVFFSRLRGSAQRLPNGNTLICESGRSRVFEVTPTGEVVWEFWTQAFDEAGQRRRLYRMHRLSGRDAAMRMRRPLGD